MKKRYKCTYCKEKFSSLEDGMEHLKTVKHEWGGIEYLYEEWKEFKVIQFSGVRDILKVLNRSEKTDLMFALFNDLDNEFHDLEEEYNDMCKERDYEDG